MAEPAQFVAIAGAIASCTACQDSTTSLCRDHRAILPKRLRSNWPQKFGDQTTPGAETPAVARAHLTRKARAAKRVLQMQRRRGYWGLAMAVLGKP